MSDPVDAKAYALWRKELKAINGELPKVMTKFHQKIGKVVEPSARSLAGALGLHDRQSAAGAIRAAAQQRGVVITASATSSVPWALGLIMGQDSQSGWFGRPKYNASSSRQFQPHIGQGWEVGGPGGPRAVNEAIRDSLPIVEVLLSQAMDEVTARAFPD